MAGRPFRFHRGALHIPEIGLWLDAHDAVKGPERVFVSHAHSDHTAAHREVIVTDATARLMAARLGRRPSVEHLLPWGEPAEFTWSGRSFRITLLPAGHICGSAMARVDWEGRSLLYTGDFKLRPGRSAERCDPAAARGVDILVMETTYGRPVYTFPATEDVLRSVVRFCREALDNDEVPVLLGYSLGKSQELLAGLAEAGLPLMLHPAVERLTRIYEELGRGFPAYRALDPDRAEGHVLMLPPGARVPGLGDGGRRVRTAVMTGWAVDAACRFRQRADAAFPLSDHADFPDLVEFVRQVRPGIVYTLHGFAADFAGTLRELGFAAEALSEQEQLTLGFGGGEPKASGFLPADSARVAAAGGPSERASDPGSASVAAAPRLEPGTWAWFAAECGAVEAMADKARKAERVAAALREGWLAEAAGLSGLDANAGWTGLAAAWWAGQRWQSGAGGARFGGAVVREALAEAAGVTPAVVRQLELKHGDLAASAAELMAGRASEGVTMAEVAEWSRAAAAASAQGFVRRSLRALLARCDAREARCLVKWLGGDLRLGLKGSLVEQAVATAFAVAIEEIRVAQSCLGGLGPVTSLAARGGASALAAVEVIPFLPVRPRGSVVPGMWGAGEVDPGTRWEPCQLHRLGGRVRIWAAEGREITKDLPELVALAEQALADDVVVDGAVRYPAMDLFPVAAGRGGVEAEADLFQPRGKPGGDGVRLAVWELLWWNGRCLLRETESARRTAMRQVRWPDGIQAWDPVDGRSARPR